MLRIHFLTSALLASLVSASDFAALGQRSVVTARAVLPPRALYGRQNQFTCAQATDTVCADGSGCCPQGAACFSSAGVGLCSVTCEAAQPTCVFNSVTACCPVGDACGGSLCIPAGLNTGSPDSSSSAAPATTTAATVTINPGDSSSSLSSGSSGLITPSTQLAVISMSVVGGNDSVAIVSSTTSVTTTPGLGSTATFGLGIRPSTSGPLQVTTNAAVPTAAALNALVNLAGLAALGLAL